MDNCSCFERKGKQIILHCTLAAVNIILIKTCIIKISLTKKVVVFKPTT